MSLRAAGPVVSLVIVLSPSSGCTIADLLGAPLACANDNACPLAEDCVDGVCVGGTLTDAGPGGGADAGFLDAGFPDAGNPDVLTLTVETAVQPAGDSVTVERDEEFTLRWSTRDVQDCSISPPVGGVAPNGTVALSLPTTGVRSFVLTCTGNGGAITSDPIEVSVASILDDDLIVLSNADLDLAIGVTVITGDVIISGASITNVDALALLTTVGGDFVLEDTTGLNALVLPALTSIGGSLVVAGADTQLERIAAPELQSIGDDARFEDLPRVEAIELPVLSSVGRDLLLGALAAPAFPDLFDLPSCVSLLVPRPLPALTTLTLPLLEAVGRDLGSAGATELSALELPLLRSVGGSVVIEELGSFAIGRSGVSLPLLDHAVLVVITNAPNVGTVSLAGLLTVEEDIAAEQLPFDAPLSSTMPSPLFHLLRARFSSLCTGQPIVFTGDLLITQQPAGPGVGVTSLDLSSLQSLEGSLLLTGLADVDVELTNLESAIGISLDGIGGPAATGSYDFPALTRVGAFGVALGALPGLNSVRFPLLASVAGPVVVNPGPGLSQLALPAPSIGGTLNLGNLDPAALLGFAVETVAGDLIVNSEFPGTQLLGLEELTVIGGHAEFYGSSLQTLAGLSALTTVGGDLLLSGAVQETDALTALQSINGGIACYGTELLSLDFPALTSLGAIVADSLACRFSEDVPGALQRVSMPLLSSVDATVVITHAPLTELSLGAVGPLTGLTLVGTALANLDGLCGVTSIENDLILESNAALVDVSGLASLTALGGLFRLRGSPSVQTCQVATLVTALAPTVQEFDFPLPAGCPLNGTCP